jgi:hypothetical protein
MRRAPLCWGLALAAGWCSPVSAQQYLAEPGSAAAGVEVRLYDFGPHLGVHRLWQVATPVALAVPIGRLTLDAGAWYAHTTVERRDGTRANAVGATDLQVRAAYVLGNDALVTTLVVNLPTGTDRLAASEYAVLAVSSSSFLAFPVNALTTGLSVTAGAAAAVPAGRWNLGLAGSVRLSSEFTPFLDDTGAAFTYRSGPEMRLRLGVDRLVGEGRLALAGTYSTFSTDEYASAGGAGGVGGIGRYRPGQRIIAEAFYTIPVGEWTLTAYLWDFYRAAGDSAGISAANRENLLAGGAVFSIPWTSSLTVEPSVEGRWSKPEVGQAFLAEVSTRLRGRLWRGTTLVGVIRLVFGRLEEPPPGIGHQIRGGSLSVFVRQLF